MEVKAGYKQTEVGVIPVDWEDCTLSSISERIMVGIASAATHAYRSRGIPLLRNQNIKSGYLDDEDILYVDPNYEAIFRNKRLQAGDLLTARTGYPGTTCVVPQQYNLAQSFTTLITRPIAQKVDSTYLCHYINSEEGQHFFEQTQIGGAQKNVNAGTLRQMPIPLPRLPEQRAIAAALADVDALLARLDQLIAKKRDLKQATMQQLLTGQHRLPGFSGEWEVKTFGEIFDYLSTATNSRADLSADTGDTYYIHYGDIHTKYHGHLDFRCERPSMISRKLCKNAALLQNGDWVMADASEDFDGVGKSIEISGLQDDIQAVAGLHTFLLRERLSTFAPGFKGHLGNLNSLHQQFLRVATGMKVFGVSKTALKNLPLPVPSFPEQTAIATLLSDMDAEIAALEARRDKTRAVKQGMMQELLTGRIRLI